jgi:hypothetical protein
MDDIAEQFALRDRFRRKLALAKTPEERMREMAIRQRAASEWAVRSSEGYKHFMRRNFKARAIDVRGLHDA